jgi:hypothetical protein
LFMRRREAFRRRVNDRNGSSGPAKLGFPDQRRRRRRSCARGTSRHAAAPANLFDRPQIGDRKDAGGVRRRSPEPAARRFCTTIPISCGVSGRPADGQARIGCGSPR